MGDYEPVDAMMRERKYKERDQRQREDVERAKWAKENLKPMTIEEHNRAQKEREHSYKRHPMYKEEVERAEKLRHTPGAVHSHDPAYENPHKNK